MVTVYERRGIEKGRKEGFQKGIEKGRKEGIEKGRKEVAKKLLDEGMAERDVARYTGLALADIRKLK